MVATTGRASPAICISRCARPKASRLSRRRQAGRYVRRHALVRRRPAGADAGTAGDGRLHGELLLAPDPGLLGADRRDLGRREPHLRAARHSRVADKRSGSSIGSPPPTSIPTSRSPRRSAPACGASRTASSPTSPIEGNAYDMKHPRRSGSCRARCGTRRSGSRPRRRRASCSATPSSTTTRRPASGKSASSARRSPTGNWLAISRSSRSRRPFACDRVESS